MRSGLLDRRVFNSKIRSQNVTGKERWLGYFLGPVGALLLNTALNSYVNMYYTDVLKLGAIWGGIFVMVFPIISKVVDVITNLVMGAIIERTRTKQGKARPWLLLAAPLLTITGVLMFLVPSGNETLTVIWVMLSYNLYYSFAYTIYAMSHMLMVPLSTRNVNQRSGLSLMTQIATMVLSGTLVSVVFPSVFLPIMGTSPQMWLLIMGIMSAISLPLVLLEYYYTKERVTLENSNTTEKKIPLRCQLKAIFTDKYLILMFAFFFIFIFGMSIRNTSLPYYCNYVLGTYNDGITQMLMLVMGGVPMGLGMFFINSLAKKFKKRDMLVIGLILWSVGGFVCMTAPTNMIVVILGQFVKNIGSIPITYVLLALFADTLDHAEWRNGFRCDGLSMSIYNIFYMALAGICMGVFNGLIMKAGYIAPPEGVVSGTVIAQPEAVKNIMWFIFLGLEAILGLVLLAIMIFINVEKTLKRKHTVIRERQKQQCLAEGREWIEPEIRAQLEQEELDRQAEEAFVKELKERCEKKGLDFDAELAKHQRMLAEKKAKSEEKERIAEEKRITKERKAEEKRAARLAKLTPEQLEAREQKRKRREERDERFWLAESEKGEAHYRKMQLELEAKKK